MDTGHDPAAQTVPLGDRDGTPSTDLMAELALGRVMGRLLGHEHDVRLGRYALGPAIASGGFGQVFRARDDELDRDVAIKVLLPAPRAETTDAHATLLAEARALARLRHPNVVEVFDVGVGEVGRRSDGSAQYGVYLVMQWLPGETLAQWRASKPDWRATIAAYVQFAMGLHAAHENGLVHGDVKPHNAIIDPQGRVRVVDFGLAREPKLARAQWSSLQSVEDEAALSTSIAGTPLYMAPEQHAGIMSPAADQFSLAVSVWQALTGTVPFDGRAVDELAAAKHAAPPVPPRGVVPPRVWRAILRALDVDPARRHPDLDAFARALVRAASPKLRRGVAALGLATAAILAGVVIQGGRKGHPCDENPMSVATLWDATTRARLSASLASLDHPDAAALASGVAVALDERAARWSRRWAEVCDQSDAGEAAVAGSIACLGVERDDLDRAVARAGSTAATDLAVLAGALGGPPDPLCPLGEGRSAEEEEEIRALEIEAARIKATHGRDYGTDLSAVDALIVQADALGRPDLAVAMQFGAADGMLDRRELEPGAERLRDAILRANAAGLHARALDVMPRLTFAYALMGDFAEARRVVAMSREHAAYHGSTPKQASAINSTAGLTEALSGNMEEAEALYGAACARLLELPDPTSIVMVCTEQLVVFATNRRDIDGAERYLHAGLEGAGRVKRPDGAMFANIDHATAEVAGQRADYVTALHAAHRGLERSRADEASDHTMTYAYLEVAIVEAMAQRWDDSIASFREAIRRGEALGHPPLGQLAEWYSRLLWALLASGRFAEVPATIDHMTATIASDSAVIDEWQLGALLMSSWASWAMDDVERARAEFHRASLTLAGEHDPYLDAFAQRLEALLAPALDEQMVATFAAGAQARRAREAMRPAAERGKIDPTEAALDSLTHAVLQARLVDLQDVPKGTITGAVSGDLRVLYVAHARGLAMLRHAALPTFVHQF